MYESELKTIASKTKQLKADANNTKSSIPASRVRDYIIYKSCVETAYHNDAESNRESKITEDELSILQTLIRELELSQEEVKLINYSVIPPVKMDIDDVIAELKNVGIIFYSKKNSTVYVANEMVRLLRRLRNKDVADKYYRRVLKSLNETQINLVCKKHNIDWKQTTGR